MYYTELHSCVAKWQVVGPGLVYNPGPSHQPLEMMDYSTAGYRLDARLEYV
jgi:hypothetical protein